MDWGGWGIPRTGEVFMAWSTSPYGPTGELPPPSSSRLTTARATAIGSTVADLERAYPGVSVEFDEGWLRDHRGDYSDSKALMWFYLDDGSTGVMAATGTVSSQSTVDNFAASLGATQGSCLVAQRLDPLSF